MSPHAIQLLTDEQRSQIDAAAMRILGDVGLEIASARVVDLLQAAGADCDNGRARLPETLVRESIASAPRHFELRGLGPQAVVRFGDGRTHVQPMIGRLHILDADGTRRRTCLADVGHLAAVCDALDHYEVLHGGAVMPEIAGVPASAAHLAGFVQTLRHTAKPFKVSCRGRDVAQDCVRLVDAVSSALGRPIIPHTTCNLVSPLQMPAELTEGALLHLGQGWPVDFASEPQMGATSPVTLAGSVAQALAESLAGVVLAQAVNPGCPVLIGTVAAAMDMRCATIALGGVEAALANAAHAQMAGYYGLASRGTGANTNAKTLDFQAGHEKMLTLLLPVLAGVDLLFYPGTLEHAETISLESLVMDHDLCATGLRAQRGIRVSDELLGVDLIGQVGPGGTFLSLPQTAQQMFAEHLVYGLRDRRQRGAWEAAGSPTPPQVAHERVEQILSQPRQPLPDRVEKALQDVVTELAGQRGCDDLIDLLWHK